jgi:hypothetical protein
MTGETTPRLLTRITRSAGRASSKRIIPSRFRITGNVLYLEMPSIFISRTNPAVRREAGLSEA